MGVPGVQRDFAAFCCIACSYIFAGRIPVFFEDLPECPICHEGSQIDRILNYNQSGVKD